MFLATVAKFAFRTAWKRHGGRTVRLWHLRADRRGAYDAASGVRDNERANWDLKVLRGPSGTDLIGSVGTGLEDSREYSCLVEDLPLVNGKRLLPGKGFVIVDEVEVDGGDQDEELVVTRGVTGTNGLVWKMMAVRKK